jgi:hypothetical protein
MKQAVPFLSCLLLVAALATHAQAEAGSLGGVEASVVLIAAGGHDSVGGLMPLPLWPPYRPRVAQPASSRTWRHPGRNCTAHCPRY